MIRVLKRISCVAAIVALLLASAVNGGVVSSSIAFAHDNLKIIKPAVNEGGWKIPGLAESRITSPRKLLPKGYGPSSVPVHVTVFTPARKFITTIPLYRLKDDQTLIVVERKVLIDGIIKCDVEGRVFMYILHCTIILEEPNGRTGYSGVFGVAYSDRDGDGKFESFEEGAPFVTADLQVPDWVLAGRTTRGAKKKTFPVYELEPDRLMSLKHLKKVGQ